MKPRLSDFEKAIYKARGNLTIVAKHYEVARSTVYTWINADERFKTALLDARGRMLDECIAVSRVVALGIPEKDAEGKIIGWRERPDSNMLKYLLSTLGRAEGFGEQTTVAITRGSVPIRQWIENNKTKTKKTDKK